MTKKESEKWKKLQKRKEKHEKREKKKERENYLIEKRKLKETLRNKTQKIENLKKKNGYMKRDEGNMKDMWVNNAWSDTMVKESLVKGIWKDC